MNEYDMPLLSNIDVIRARHYLIYLEVNFHNQTLKGSIFIFFDKTSNCERDGEFCFEGCSCKNVQEISETEHEQNTFPIILECNDLLVKEVSHILASKNEVKSYLSSNHSRTNHQDYKYWNSHDREKVCFVQNEWSLIIGEDNFLYAEFPKIIVIDYSTTSGGSSIYWRNCENEVCFFTSGSLINNRSLLPSQDRPQAMATWQAWIYAPKEYFVSMTGDCDPLFLDMYHNERDASTVMEHKTDIDTITCFYYFTTMVLPTSTIAISCGKWAAESILSEKDIQAINSETNSNFMEDLNMVCAHVPYPCHMIPNHHRSLTSVSLVCSSKLKEKAMQLLRFLKYILKATNKIFGKYPFTRIEIVIMPRCFSHLGLASPNVIFLSKCILLDDSFFYTRLAHEISHSWYGITIGPKIWEEEWISEGFASYLEDSIFAFAIKEKELEEKTKSSQNLVDDSEFDSIMHLKNCIRYKILCSERENAREELQILSPINSDSSESQEKVINGLDPVKPFLQSHYLKGYFLLYKLCTLVSKHSFDKFLGMFARKYHGQLITSENFIDSFFNCFPSVQSDISPSEIFENWLRVPEINLEIDELFGNLNVNNPLVKIINEHYSYWISYNKFSKKEGSKLKVFRNKLFREFKFTCSDQIILLFEKFLLCSSLNRNTLSSIYSFYKIESRNCEIQHRWCELIIKNNYPDNDFIRNFLIENQAMGVYLYGELVISGRSTHVQLARDLFDLLKDEYDTSSKEIISDMIFPK